MTTNELRACPFCGRNDRLIFEPLPGCTDVGNVACVCGASYTTITQGVDDWNTRPIEDALHARIAELETEKEWEKECEMRVIKDGNAWCFVLPDFQNLQLSPACWMEEGVLDKIYKELRSGRDE